MGVLKYYVKINLDLRNENKVNENKSIIILWGIKLYVKHGNIIFLVESVAV